MTIAFLAFTKFLSGQEPGEFRVFFGPINYQLGSKRSITDTNIYLQENGIINEHGRQQHVYHYKNLFFHPYELAEIKFTDLSLFYESDKLTRIDLLRMYVDSTEKLNDTLQDMELQKIRELLTHLAAKKGKKKNTYMGNFYREKGYQWKQRKVIMQTKMHTGQVPAPIRLLIVSIRYKWY
jgi:hypothetical protein